MQSYREDEGRMCTCRIGRSDDGEASPGIGKGLSFGNIGNGWTDNERKTDGIRRYLTSRRCLCLVQALEEMSGIVEARWKNYEAPYLKEAAVSVRSRQTFGLIRGELERVKATITSRELTDC